MSAPGRHTDVAKSSARMPDRPPPSGRLGVQSTMRAAALLPGACLRPKSGRQGPMTPAQISQYAAPPIRYGQPPQTVACLPG